ncbi:MAG: malonyl-CoA decarboxylase family protein [Proteobacteria bacterium]|nr:malonyl-CoA decarboxylase family protein [Pseudomonadota bacterium]MBI3497528.1 malonyl-CoA decarboxylase family protein [Pseudomonadota bacterium]
MSAKTPDFFDRTLANLSSMWRDLAERAGFAERRIRDPGVSEDDAETIRTQFRECLDAKGGEVSARARAAELGGAYLGLSTEGRKRFLKILATDFALDTNELGRAVESYVASTDEVERLEAERALRFAMLAPRVRLVTQFASLPDGVKFLVDLRADLLGSADGDAALESLDLDLKALLASWFDVGFLELRRITWDSPASLLEKLSRYEAVHRVRSWGDLKNRLDADRRCYGFFHPRMPNEPLIFLEVALVRGMAGSIQAVLDERAPLQDPRQADTAIFYSISNTQEGLRGIGFGSFLIKNVVDDLALEFPRLQTYATLSPIPGFRRWLGKLTLEDLNDYLATDERVAASEAAHAADQGEDFRALLEQPRWHAKPEWTEILRAPLSRLAAVYLLAERRGGKPLDPVARFHLGNGASVERLNWLADTSPKGLVESAGMMVNYGYRSADIEANHETYALGGPVAASGALKRLVAGSPGATSRASGIARLQDAVGLGRRRREQPGP